MKISGNAWKFPQDDINTDTIRKKMYAHLPLKEQATHCMEQLDPAFAAKAARGDIMVTGRNFGAGSSTPAYSAIIALGISAVVAESFGRIFFRSSISAGLLALPCPGILELVNAGDRVEIDLADGIVRNMTSGRTLRAAPLPGFLREMVELGGEKPYIKARLQRQRATGA
jgi:3-isopropylmalate/(R)-2-methylmalate dehydratase small subunit